VLKIGDTTARTIVQAPSGALVRFPSVSPDGRFMAYASNESGRMEVYVTEFPGPGPKWQVSTLGGDEPLWSRSGRELFFRDNSHVVSARVTTSPSFSVVSRSRLFEDTYMRSNTVNWDVMADDQRFVMLRAADQSAQLIVVTNWDDVARRRLAPTPKP
jgi:Tol biopolymer transport system component